MLSKTYQQKQQLTVFEKVFFCNEQFEFTWSLFENQEDIEEKKLKHWFKYWEVNGDALVLDVWFNKYGQYLQDTEQNINSCSDYKIDLDMKNDPNKYLDKDQLLLQNSDCNQNLNQWQILWDDHYFDICNRQYQIFETIYSDYCSLYTLENNSESNQEKTFFTDLNHLNEELELIKSLGLPLAFGSKNKRNPDKLGRNKFDYEVNDFFSAEERSDCEYDTILGDFDESKMQSKLEDMEISSKIIKKKKKINRRLRNIPKSILEDKTLVKYWRNRFNLFSRYDEGIRLDRESWFSVTPEKIAMNLAKRLKCDIIIDGFCGSGGNAIQFAMTCSRVIAIDIDPEKIQMARHNAKIYGVENKIDFIVGDFLLLCSSLKGDVVFLSPPWGGPEYRKKTVYDIEQFLLPIPATDLLDKSRKITENIALFLPRNSDMKQIIRIAGNGNRVEVEHFYLESKLVAIAAIYGENIISN